jgi:hypothetical protein
VEATWKSLKKEKSKLGRKSDPVILGIWAWLQKKMGIPWYTCKWFVCFFALIHQSSSIHLCIRFTGVGPSAE